MRICYETSHNHYMVHLQTPRWYRSITHGLLMQSRDSASWVCSPVAELLPSMHKVLVSSPAQGREMRDKREEREGKGERGRKRERKNKKIYEVATM